MSAGEANAFRLTVDLSLEVGATLQYLAARHGHTIAQEILVAISLAKYIDQKIEAGAKFLVRHDGATEEILFKDWLRQ